MHAKLVTLVLGPFDPGDYLTLPAYLIGEDRVIYLSEGSLWAIVAHKSAVHPDYYESSMADHSVMIAEDVAGTTADVVPPLIERWANMTALEFIIFDMVGAVCDELGLTL